MIWKTFFPGLFYLKAGLPSGSTPRVDIQIFLPTGRSFIPRWTFALRSVTTTMIQNASNGDRNRTWTIHSSCNFGPRSRKVVIFFGRPIWNECRGVGIKVLEVYHTWLKKSKADDWLPQFPCLVLGSRGVFFFSVVLFSMGLWVPGIMRPPWRHTIYSWKMISTLHQIGSPISQVQRERIQSSWHIMLMTCFRFWLPTLGTQNFETKIVFWIFFVPLKLLIWWVIQWWVKGRYPETHINIGKSCGE